MQHGAESWSIERGTFGGMQLHVSIGRGNDGTNSRPLWAMIVFHSWKFIVLAREYGKFLRTNRLYD